jgi:hypothetical protein
MSKYMFLELKIDDGGHEYYSTSVLEVKENDTVMTTAHKAARHWYDGVKPTMRGWGQFFFTDECVLVSVTRAEKISAAEYDLLKHFIK